MTNMYFERLIAIMQAAQEQVETLQRTTNAAILATQEFVEACDKALASGDERCLKELAQDSELGGSTPEEEVRLLKQSAEDSIAMFNQKLGLLALFAE